MSYNYQAEKEKIFTEKGQKDFLKVRDHVNKMINFSGAFMMQKAWKPLDCGDSFLFLAYVDRLVELEEIKEIKYNCMGQHRVFIKNEK